MLELMMLFRMLAGRLPSPTFFIAIITLCGLLSANCSYLHAQDRPRTARIGILRVDARDSPAAVEAIRDLKQGLSNLGYVEAQSPNFDIRWADNKLDHLPVLADELVRLQPDVIVPAVLKPCEH